MKPIALLLVILSLCRSTAVAQALPNGPTSAPAYDPAWQNVRDLDRDDAIKITTTSGHTRHCNFNGAIGDRIFCTSYGFDASNDFSFDRSSITVIRRDDGRRNFRWAIGGMAAAGFVAGSILGPGRDSTAPRFVSGLAGAGFGFLAGCAVAVPVAFLVPGRLIYRAHGASSLHHETH